jgi:membrane-associated phospholipid phosphatase
MRLSLGTVLFILFVMSCPSHCGTDASPDLQPKSLGYAFDSFYNRVWTLPESIWTDSSGILSDKVNIYWFLAAAGGSMALRQGGADDRIFDSFDDHKIIANHKDLDKFVDHAGSPDAHFVLTGLWYLSSVCKSDNVNTERAWTMMRALALTGTTTVGLKLAINDRTPNDKALAWPSGHTSSSFTVAAVLDEFYGPSVGIPAYIGAGFVGYRMVESGDHWPSDIVFGAVLGYIVGHHVAGGKDLTVAGFQVLPIADSSPDRSVVGLALHRRF